ncbi:MAG TPA: octaprenyl diphosphate synthase [Quisquiliibacterium sp.]|nr:octaprenyl diphosphate synthase [Quisquiliibacterium sp.]HQD82263.1 octaprenyl diphosphate synthase [Quisquiliibacterium sp.]HQN14212.1 octaprenyl diphosphate synthase [Quisquiliibacterium sp.]HQP68241.1 octaprenyl diphosphate synthase [Quisquiliibacterium sp.]
MKPADLFPVLADDLDQVDRVIRLRLSSEVALINTVADYIIGAGGKRMRPVLLLLVARALGYQGTHHHLLAAVIEFIHTATLLHDDVVDESELRRGRGTANAMFGNAASVLVGDFLYSRAFQMMVEPDDMRVMRVLSDATNVIAEGEVLQLMNCNDPDVDETRYLQVIRYKTAKLFEAAGQIGAILCGAPAEVEEAAAEYGRRMGTAFQLIDDVLDYSGDTGEIGKNVGDDLREGKATLPLIHVMAHGTGDERAMVRQAIEQGHTEHFDAISAAIRRTGALEYARDRARGEAAAAAAALSHLPISQYRDALLYLSTYSIERNH